MSTNPPKMPGSDEEVKVSVLIPDIDKICDIPLAGKFIDENGDPYVAIPEDGNFHSVVPVRGSKIRDYIRVFCRKVYDEYIVDSKLDNIIGQIVSACLVEGSERVLYTRVGRDGNDILVDGIKNVYRFKSGRWGICSRPTRLFRRFQGMRPLSDPKTGGNIRRIFEFVKVGDQDDQLLIMAYLVFAFVPDVPHPALVSYGPQGSAKSSFLRNMAAIIDPNVNEDVPYWDEKEFMLVASQRWLVGLDNVGSIAERFSDLLCKLVTGAAIAKRKLYTDEDLILRRFQRVLLINGINLPVDKPDLMDRCLLVPLERIPDSDRLDEHTLKKRFEEAKGDILGGCFDALAAAMEILPKIKVDRLPRLADFGKWGCAIAIALGYTQEDFLRAYTRNVERQHEESLDASAIATLITYYFKSHGHGGGVLSGTPTHILGELTRVGDLVGVDPRQMPRSARSFGRKLQEIKPTLEARGYFVEQVRGKDRIIRIHPPIRLDTPTSLTSLPSSSPDPSGLNH